MSLYRFVATQKTEFPVTLLCQVVGVSRSGYYEWVRQGDTVSGHDRDDAELAVKIGAAFKKGRGAYGSPRVFHELRRQGVRTSRKRVARLMAADGLIGKCGRRRVKTTVTDPNAQPAGDLVERNFQPPVPDQLWYGDITYIRTWEGWLFLATVIDACTKMVIGHATSKSLHTDIVDAALRHAVTRRGRDVTGVVFHSDRGCQYTSAQYRQLCQTSGVRQSMGSTGVCWDNAAAESFFATLKRELIYTQTWPTIREAETAVFEWIEVFYNRERLHSSIEYMTPIEAEARHNYSHQTA